MSPVAFPLFIVLLTASPVPAEAPAAPDARPDPGTTYQVVNVPADDELNVRAQPGIQAEVLDTLAPGTRGVVASGVWQPHAGGTWFEIITDDGERGWVNARFVTAEDEESPQFPLSCGGTEPFWSLEIAAGEADYSTMAGDEATWAASDWKPAAGRQAGYHFAVRLQADPEAEPAQATDVGWLTVSRARDYCSDGMSERRHPYDMTLITPDEQVLSGCCARAR